MSRNFFSFLLRLVLLFALLACAAGGGANDPDSSGGNTLTPTPPVPVFGDFLLGVATSEQGIASNLRGLKAMQNQNKALSISGGGIQVDETRNAISDISFEPDNEQNPEIDFPGVFVVELVRQSNVLNQEFPDFGVTQIPFDSYRRFEMKFEKLDSEDIPGQLLPDPLVSSLLVDHTFVVQGSFVEAEGKDVNGDGQISSVPYQIISDNEVEVEVSSPNFFVVSPDKVNFFFIAFQIEAWFNGLLPQFQNLTPSDLSGGVAVIRKESSNAKIDQILQDFENNTERSCKSAPSDDGDFEQSDVDEESGSEPL